MTWSVGVREQAAAATSGHSARDSSNGADLAAGLSATPSPQSPIAEAAQADAATANGSQGSATHEVGSVRQEAVGQSALSEEAWEPSWPAVDVTPADEADATRDEPAQGAPAPLVVSLTESRADASGSGGAPQMRGKGGIASGFAAQHAAQAAVGAEHMRRGHGDGEGAASTDVPLDDDNTAVTVSSAESDVAVGANGRASIATPAQQQQQATPYAAQQQPGLPAAPHVAGKGAM